MRYAIDSDKIKKDLGWKPKTSFIKGIENTFDWYFRNKSYYSLLKKKDITNRVGLKKWLKKELYYLGVKEQEWVL